MPALDGRVVRNVVDQRVFGYRRFVELQKRDTRRVGTPPVAAVIAAPVELFGIHPVERSVEQLSSAVGRQRSLAGRADGGDKNIVVLDERDAAAIGAERRLGL